MGAGSGNREGFALAAGGALGKRVDWRARYSAKLRSFVCSLGTRLRVSRSSKSDTKGSVCLEREVSEGQGRRENLCLAAERSGRFGNPGR